MIQRILSFILIGFGTLGIILYSLPSGNTSKKEAPTIDRSSFELLGKFNDIWERTEAPKELTEEKVWKLPLSLLDAIFLKSTTPETTLGIEKKEQERRISLKKDGAYVFLITEPFFQYIISDTEKRYSLEILQNGVFSVANTLSSTGEKRILVSSLSAILRLHILFDGKEATALDIYPGTLFSLDPKTAKDLVGADAVRVLQLNGDPKAIDVLSDNLATLILGEKNIAVFYAMVGLLGNTKENGNLEGILHAYEKEVLGKKTPSSTRRGAMPMPPGGDMGMMPPLPEEAMGMIPPMPGDDIGMMPPLPEEAMGMVPPSPALGTPSQDASSLNSPFLLNKKKEAALLQGILLKELLTIVKNPKSSPSGVAGTLEKIKAIHPGFEEEGLKMIRYVYSRYWVYQVYQGNSEVLFGTDALTKAIRTIYGCRMSIPYLSGVSNIFSWAFLQKILPPTDEKIALTPERFEGLLRSYIAGQIKNYSPEKKEEGVGQCSSEAVGITQENIRQIWFFLTQYLSRTNIFQEHKDIAPSKDTIGITNLMLQLGNLYIASLGEKKFEIKTNEAQAMIRVYREIFGKLITKIENLFFLSRNPYTFREDILHDNDVNIDASVLASLEQIPDFLTSFSSRLTSSDFVRGLSADQAQEIGNIVRSRLTQDINQPLSEILCVIVHNKEYRFPVPGATPVCRAPADTGTASGASLSGSLLPEESSGSSDAGSGSALISTGNLAPSESFVQSGGAMSGSALTGSSQSGTTMSGSTLDTASGSLNTTSRRRRRG